MGDGASDIIIKGGSVELLYDETLYGRNPNDPWSHRNAKGKVVRIVISGDLNYDSGSHPDGLLCEIRVVCR